MTPRHTRALLATIALLRIGRIRRDVSGARAGGHVGPAPSRDGGASDLAHAQRRLREPPLQLADGDHAGECHEPRVEVGAPERSVRRLAVEPVVVDGIMVHHATAQRRDGGWTRGRAASSGSIATRRRRTPVSAAARTTAASRFSATRSTWGHSTAHLIALDAKSGGLRVEHRRRRRACGNRLLNHDGAARRQRQSDRRICRRRISASAGSSSPYDGKTGKEAWRFSTIPTPAKTAATWAATPGNRAAARCGSRALTIPNLNVMYWGIGNPGPDWNGDSAPATTSIPIRRGPRRRHGRLKWHFQFSPNDGTITTRCRCRCSPISVGGGGPRR